VALTFSGLDVQAASQSGSIKPDDGPVDPSRKATAIRRNVLDYQDVISSVARCEKPVIALMHGYSYGLAIDLSSACDVRMATKDVKFSIKEVDIGLAADVGTLSRFPKVIGGLTSWTKEVALSGRVWGADEAEKNGYISRSFGSKKELISEGVKLATYIATKSPVAVQGTKNILDAAWGRTVEDNLTYTAIWNQAMIQSDDMRKAMLSGIQKKSVTFAKL
jgi:Delta3,5-Delta2,4-dienoyl-CoA isomerase